MINHYAIRSTDTFLMKQARGRGMGAGVDKYVLNSQWHRRANRNETEDRTILARWPEVEAELTRLRALPGVAGAEADCIDWFHQTAARILTPDKVRSWTTGPKT